MSLGAIVDETVVYQVCKEQGFSDCKLVNALAKYESGYESRKFVAEKTGSMGLMQIQCGTAKMMGVKDCNKLYQPRYNLMVGMQYLESVRKRHNIKNVRTWLAAWNAGQPIICKDHNPGFCKPGQFYNQGFVNDVYAIYQQMEDSDAI